MTTEELILPYKLEQHLVEICNSNETYHKLWAAWDINKKMCQDVLSTVVMNYPHYTNHDVSHCEAIITNIEMLLGEKAIRALSPTDTWLLLHAAYLHDIGMVIECKKIERNWESREFQEYLHEMEDSNDDSMAKNAKFINSLGDKLGKKENVSSWPVHVRNAVTILIAEYYRRQHAETSGSYVKDMGSMFHLDFSFNNLIQERLIQLLGDIICLHTQSGRKILDLDYRTNGFNADYAHPRFIAQMLRMGDLLDADNNRFNSTNEFVFGEIPDSSKNHWEKHKSARHILITPDIIEYRADCESEQVYRETRNFLSWLKEEVEFWALNWKSIMPANINGSAPKLGKCELLLNGVPDIQGLSDLQFSISPEKAFEIIEGSNLYEDRFVFLREVIQNALDACKVQMWRDLSEGKYKSWISENVKNLKELQPFEIEKGVFNNYGIEVRMYSHDNDHIKVVVKDNGIGLSAQQLKKICNVGVSYSGDKERKEEIESMPLWLRPTAGFGIGLQSIFLVTKEFEIYSKAAGEDAIYAKVTSRRKNGYVQVTKSDKLKHQGTEIHIIVSKKDFDDGVTEGAFLYIKGNYDPFFNKDHMVYYVIFGELHMIMEHTYFLTNFFWNDTLIDTIQANCLEKINFRISNERYIARELPQYRMELWDKQTCTKFDICLQSNYTRFIDRHTDNYFFRGIEIQSNVSSRRVGVGCTADFYGLDTKEVLAFDRKKIKAGAIKQMHEIIDDAIDFYLEEIEKSMFVEEKNRKTNENSQIYTYWAIVSLKKKMELLTKYKRIFENICVPVDILEKNSNNMFTETSMDFKNVLDMREIAIVGNLRVYNHIGEQIDIQAIENLLNGEKVPFSKIIITERFIEELRNETCDKIMVISEGEKVLLLYTLTIQEKELPEPDEDTKKYLIKSLLREPEVLDCGSFTRSAARKYIASIRGYEIISTTDRPFCTEGIIYPSLGYILSPITINQWENNKHLGENKFVEKICAYEEFSNLLDYVYENQLGQPEGGKYSKHKIKEEYERFIREMYRIMKEDEVNNEHEKNDHSPP
mgnify:FL=1